MWGTGTQSPTTARRHELHFTQAADELIAAALARIRANRHLLSA
jgi:hypothetical protein